MNTLHHLEALELDKVLKMLSSRAAMDDAKELALSLRPETDFKKVEILLNELINKQKTINTCLFFNAPPL